MGLPWRVLAWPSLWAVVACAPSPRIVYQGNATFEYCYAADQNPELSAAQREACWLAWLSHYTRHQSADRVDYALRRIEALELGDLSLVGVPSEPAEAEEALEAAGSEDPERAALDPIRSDNSLKAYATQAGPPPEKGCKIECERLHAACAQGCAPNHEPCLKTCQTEERICVGGCY